MERQNIKIIDNAKGKKIEEIKMYEDYKSFQGISFENNVNSINHLYFGQGLKISDIPFIIKEENSDKNILAVNWIKIKSQTFDKTICYPKKCIHIAFYFDNSIFYLTENNTLEIYKLGKDKITKHIIQQNEVQNRKIKISDFKCDKLKEMFEEVKKINKQNNVLDNYEILFHILKDILNLDLKRKKARKDTKTFKFNFPFNNFDYSVEIKFIEDEVDSVGMIREKLYLNQGQVRLKDGINSIIEYVKKKNNKKAIEYINNSFKCPIIFKNFDEEIIPENKTLIMEIKSGFDFTGVKDQLISRIRLLKDCFFKQGEKPSFFIGLINLDSNHIEKLSQYNNESFDFNENTLIISCIDSEYCEIDLSYEVSNDYLLYKEIKNLSKKMDNMETKMDDKFKVLDNKFDSLIEALKQSQPGFTLHYNEILKIKKKRRKKG